MMNSCKEKLETYLRENRVAYHLQHHPQAFSAEAVAASVPVPVEMMVKVVVVIADDKPVMLVVPASTDVVLGKAASLLKAHKVHLAHETQLRELFPDCELGTMPPFGNLYQLPVYVDQKIAENKLIYFQAGTHRDVISLAYHDFDRLVKAQEGNFSQEAGLSLSEIS